ncbi:hypothetical protein OE88DRAFT_896429 [Heliocybe sulcata]|uniref:Uncharacterized protein n=1 Tax=Heliocybe sulcata TaxID=5364 RepID=A0A5C3MNZ9_9AGAM|nr:hypothetical protein OE88DRAFT_896429 [Heliocybe sulcata]
MVARRVRHQACERSLSKGCSYSIGPSDRTVECRQDSIDIKCPRLSPPLLRLRSVVRSLLALRSCCRGGDLLAFGISRIRTSDTLPRRCQTTTGILAASSPRQRVLDSLEIEHRAVPTILLRCARLAQRCCGLICIFAVSTIWSNWPNVPSYEAARHLDTTYEYTGLTHRSAIVTLRRSTNFFRAIRSCAEAQSPSTCETF